MAKNLNSLKEQIDSFQFHPEVYVYPTSRMYSKLNNFNLNNAEFTKEVNLYFHIPFCKQICSYCGYLKVIDSKNLREQYVTSLIKEIKMYKKILQNKVIKTVHFGGGTPSLLSSFDLKRIINTLLEINPFVLQTADEVSIEATPESVDFKKFKEYKKLGINRVSMGFQTLMNNEITLCQRKNKVTISLRAINILRKVGIQNIVVDLMIGIEGQTVKSFENSIKLLLKSKPETVELYAVGLMPNTYLKNKKYLLMSNKEIYDCYKIGRNLFLNAGYQQDCHNRYILPGKGSFFQEDYLFSGMSVIGFGAGARTYAKNVHYRNNYFLNSSMKAIIEYIKDVNSKKLPIKSGIFLSSEEKMRQYVIYNIESLDKKDFKKLFGVDFKIQFNDLYSELIKTNLIQEDWRKIWLTSKGLIYRDLICKQFFSKKMSKLEEKYRLI